MVLRPDDVPEVAAYLAAEQALKDFLDSNPEFYEVYKHLVERRNDAMEQADKAVRQTGDGCGPFTVFRASEEYDIDALVEAIGTAEFARLGGSVEVVTKCKVEKQKLVAAISSGAIPAELVESIKKTNIRYSGPKKIGLP